MPFVMKTDLPNAPAQEVQNVHNAQENVAVIRCRALSKSFISGDVKQAVLSGVEFSIAAGETVSILGESGSGKTTLLHLLGGLDDADSGVVEIDGRDLATLSANEAAAWRNRSLAYIFQFHLLLPEFSALENTAMPLLLRRVSQAEAMATAAECLAAVNLSAHGHKIPGKLSGGERQRVAVARALCGSPRCILADEPTGNLDRKNADSVFETLLSASHERHTSLILVSHDERLARRANRVLSLTDGKLVTA